MDGLLIDSEDKYTICTNHVLKKYGKPDLPWNIKAQLQGRPGPAAGKIFSEWAQLPVTREQYMSEVKELQEIHFPTTKPLAGIRELLSTLKRRTDPRVEMALATSSMQANFELKTAHLEDDVFYPFEAENRILGDDPRIGKGRGKPAPDIYLVALETINARIRREGGKEIEPQECLVFEDSVPGVEAGRRAGMQVVWCPHEGLLNEYRGREPEVLAGLMGEYKEIEEKNETIGVMDPHGQVRKQGSPGEIGDGWARLLKTLENFPYSDYGINVLV
jgi:pseudouridine-5'-monophosphatase